MKIPGLTNRHRIMLYAAGALLCLGAALSLYEIRSDTFGPLAKTYLETLFDRRIEVGEASFTVWGRVTLRDVRVHNPPGSATPYLAVIPRMRFYLGMTGGETSAFRPTSMTMDRPELSFERPDTGPWNTDRLFRAQAPRNDHPTFTLPISLRGATVSYRDSHVGSSGIALRFDDVDAVFTVVSDGAEITNALVTDPIALENGGDLVLALQSHPNARKASATVTLRSADIRLVKPYYEFLSFLEFRSGRGTGHYRVDFLADTWTGEAAIDIQGAEIHHAASRTVFRDATPRLAFRTTGRPGRIELHELSVRWYQSTVTGRGYFPARGSDSPAADVVLATADARAEDLAFLLCDPLFRPTGTLSGSCRLRTGNALDSRYGVTVELTPSAIRYGELLQKPAGTRGKLEIDGRLGRRPDRVVLHLGGSRGELISSGDVWTLNLDRARSADLKAHLAGLSDRDDLDLTGVVSARLRLGDGGRVSGTVELEGAGLSFAEVAVKPIGTPMRLNLEARVRPDGWSITDGDLQVLASRLHFSGNWTGGRTQWTANVVRLFSDDLFAVLPRARARAADRISWRGPIAGRLEWQSRGDGAGDLSAVVDLTAAALEIGGAGRKAAGVPGDLRIAGSVAGSVLAFQDGRLRLRGTTLSASGEIGTAGLSLVLKGRGTPLDGLANFLASSFWSGLGQLETSGTGDVEISIQGREGLTTVRAELVATWARLHYGDTWTKPAGQSFRARASLVQMPEVTRVEKLEIAQGGSTVLATGTISNTRPATLDANVTAQVDVPRFIEHTPGLSRIAIDRRNAAEALRLLADGDDRATIQWRASGTLEEPRLDLAMREIVGRAVVNTIARQVRRFASIITAPVTFGFDVIRGRRSEESPALSAPPQEP